MRRSTILIAVLIILCGVANAHAGSWLFTNPKFQAFDSNGDPLSGGKLHTYDCGTTTNKATYPTAADAAAATNANANPIVLDSRGEADVYGKGCTKFLLKTSADVQIWSEDNIELGVMGGIPGYYLSEYVDTTGPTTSAFQNAIDDIASAESILVVDVDDALSENVTVPATLTLTFIQGNTITTTGYTLTINGPMIAGPFQIFSGTGTEVFGAGYVTEALPQWWGGVPDGSTDNASAINDALASGVKLILLSNGTWGIDSPILLLNSLVTLRGAGMVGTEIAPLSADISGSLSTNALIINQVNAFNGTIERIRFPNSGVSYTGYAISAEEGGSDSQECFISLTLKDCWFDLGTLAAGAFNGGMLNSWIANNQLDNMKVGFNLTGTAGSANDIHFVNNKIADNQERSFIASDSTIGATRLLINGLTTTDTNQQFLINIDNATNSIFNNITMTASNSSGTVPGLASINNSSNITLSNCHAIRSSGDMKGITISGGSSVSIIASRIVNVSGTGNYAILVEDAGNDVLIDGLYVTGGDEEQISTNGAGGHLLITDSVFTGGNSSVIDEQGTETINITLEGCQLLNSEQDAGSDDMIIFATSGRFHIKNCTIGIDDGTGTPGSIFKLTGTGAFVMEGNTFIGGIDIFDASHTQYASEEQLLGSEQVNLSNTGAAKRTIFTLPANTTAIITKVVVRDPAASLSGGSDFDIGSGANAGTWRQAIDLSSMTATTDYMVIPAVAATPTKYTIEPAAAEFGIKPITGATANPANATIDVYGILN